MRRRKLRPGGSAKVSWIRSRPPSRNGWRRIPE
jgi:hypothetical protein